MAQSVFIYQDPEGFKPFVLQWGPGLLWTVHQVRVHLNGPCTFVENLTLFINSGTAAVYDTMILRQPMLGISDIVYTPDAPMHLGRDDELDMDYGNTDGLIHGVEIVFSTRE